MDNNVLTALVLAALDDSAIKALNERVDELAELGFKPLIVDELPEEGNDHTLYLVPQEEPGEDPWYYEYLWLDDEWEKIGTTSINFEDYYTKSEVDDLLENTAAELQDNIDTLSDHVDTVESDLSGSIGTLEQDLADEVSAREAAITAEAEARADDVADLEQAIQDEESARIQAIQDEADARAQAIQDEADARAEDVTALQESISELSGTLDDDIQELEDLIDTKADKDRFFDGRSEDWDEKTTEQKQDIWLGMVEDYVQLDIAETYDINSALGLDPQEPIVSDLYEDEAIDLTNQIIGGSF